MLILRFKGLGSTLSFTGKNINTFFYSRFLNKVKVMYKEAQMVITLETHIKKLMTFMLNFQSYIQQSGAHILLRV